MSLDKQKALTEILERRSAGENLRSILPNKDRASHLPGRRTFYEWLAEDKQMAHQYACACEDGAEVRVEEMEDIAKQAKDATDVQRARLLIDTRKWALSKELPKKYGDKLQLSGDAENPIAVTQTTIIWGGNEIKV